MSQLVDIISTLNDKTYSIKDPCIEAIIKKRTPFIENVYNKNLRPLKSEVKEQSLSTSDEQLNSLKNREDNEERPKSILVSELNVELYQSQYLISEKTNLTRISLDIQKKSDDIYSNDLITYENYCKDLGIVPCSIICKSLSTSSLILNNYGIGSVGALALSQALKTNLSIVKLDLSGNSIGPRGIKYLVKSFEENSTITDLNLSNNDIGIKGVKYVVELFKKNRFIRDLNLSHNNFTDDDGILLADAFEDQLFHSINLSNNSFSEKSGIAFGKWIADNTSIVEMDLSWNHLRHKGAIQMAKGVSENNKLIKLNLSWNGFENDGAEALGKALVHNVMLEELHLKCNRIGPAGFAKLCGSLKDNNSLKRLYIGKNHINEEVTQAVFKLFQSINPLTLELLDISEVSIKPTIQDHIKAVKEIHSNFNCVYGFLNSGESKKNNNLAQDALNYIKEFCEKNSISLMDLFAKLDSDGSMSVSYDEFKQGLRKAKVPISPAQIDALIKYLDKDQDGEIDFSELVIGQNENQQNNNN